MHAQAKSTHPGTPSLPTLAIATIGVLLGNSPAHALEWVGTWGEKGAGIEQFDNPFHLATDHHGNVYVADQYNHRIQKFDPNGVFIFEAGVHGKDPGGLLNPSGVAVAPDGSIFVANTHMHQVQKFDSSGAPGIRWGSKSWGTPEDGEFNAPTGIATDAQGAVYVLCLGNNRFQKFDNDGNFIYFVGEHRGNQPGMFNQPMGIALDSSGNIYVADTGNCRIQKFSSDGRFLIQWGDGPSNEPGKFHFPFAISISPDHRVFVADNRNHRIQEFTTDGKFIATWETRGDAPHNTSTPVGIVATRNGDLYVANASQNRILRFKIGNPSQPTAKTQPDKPRIKRVTPPGSQSSHPQAKDPSIRPPQLDHASIEHSDTHPPQERSIGNPIPKKSSGKPSATPPGIPANANHPNPIHGTPHKNQRPWNVGDKGFMDWSGDAFHYYGEITEIKNDRYFIRFADGDMEWRDAEHLRVDDIKPGDKIQANWKNRGHFFPGTITTRTDNQISILYDDGDREDTTIGFVRLPPP